MPPGSANHPAARAQPREVNNDLDRNAFLNLLMMQLRHQDPLSPMEDTQFIAQMAQFTALEQMTHMNQTMMRQQSFQMIGQTIYGVARNPATGGLTEVFGTVNEVRVIAGEPWLVVGSGNNEQMLRPSDVQFVFGDNFTDGMLQNINNSVLNSQNIALIGQYVQAITIDSSGNPSGFVEGRVEYIDFSSRPPALVIGNNRVFLEEVLSVSDRAMIIGQNVDVYVGNPRERVTGQIRDIRIFGEDLYLVVDGVEGNIVIDRINYITESLRLLQRSQADPSFTTSHAGETGRVIDAFIRGGQTWMRIDTGDDRIIEFTFEHFFNRVPTFTVITTDDDDPAGGDDA